MSANEAGGDCARSQDWAHSPPDGAVGQSPHGLDDHLREVGRLAASFSTGGTEALLTLAGQWHDLGKRRPGFQRYIRSVGGREAHIEGRIADLDKTHSAAGALWAHQHLSSLHGRQGTLLSRLLQYVIAGHHAGLDNWDGGPATPGLADRLASEDARREFVEAIDRPSPSNLLNVLLPDGFGLTVAGINSLGPVAL